MEISEKILSDQERAFVESYVIHLQKTRAAKDAGYSEKTAGQIGYEIYNRSHVKQEIEKILKERTISAQEVIKLVSDTAQSNLTDYYKPVLVQRTEYKKVSIPEYIEIQKLEILKKEEFCSRKGLTEKEFDEFQESIQWYRDDILKAEIELKFNPDGFKIISTEPDLVEEMQLDMDALIRDKEKGKVKKIKYGRDGLEVEMYSALDAQEKIMKMHGVYEKDNEQSRIKLPETVNVIVHKPEDAD